jgi:hypothetical protein
MGVELWLLTITVLPALQPQVWEQPNLPSRSKLSSIPKRQQLPGERVSRGERRVGGTARGVKKWDSEIVVRGKWLGKVARAVYPALVTRHSFVCGWHSHSWLCAFWSVRRLDAAFLPARA